MATENRDWGYGRIVGALANLGHALSDETVRNILRRHGISLSPRRKHATTWNEFIRSLSILKTRSCSRSDSCVSVMQPTKHRERNDVPGVRRRWVFVQRKMVSGPVMFGHIEMHNVTTSMLQHDEYVQDTKCHSRYRENINGSNALSVMHEPPARKARQL